MLNEKKPESRIKGKTIVITGVLSKTRSQFAAEIRKKGGIMAGSVTAKTDYLIVGRKFGSVKVSAAFKHGTFSVTEEEFLEIMNAEE